MDTETTVDLVALSIIFIVVGFIVYEFKNGVGAGGGISNLVNAGTGASVAESASSAGTALWNFFTTGSFGDQ